MLVGGSVRKNTCLISILGENQTSHYKEKYRLTMHNPENHITFGQNIRDVEMIGVGAPMDDSIHVQIQVIKLG